jgi:hypothetical protein
VLGGFTGNASFDSITLSSVGMNGMFLARYDATGTVRWAASASGTDWTQGSSVAVLPDESAYVTGWFEGSSTFGPTTLTSAGETDMFLAKIAVTSAW